MTSASICASSVDSSPRCVKYQAPMPPTAASAKTMSTALLRPPRGATLRTSSSAGAGDGTGAIGTTGLRPGALAGMGSTEEELGWVSTGSAREADMTVGSLNLWQRIDALIVRAPLAFATSCCHY